MLRPAWQGVFDCKKGLYYSDPKNSVKDNTNINNINNSITDSLSDNTKFNAKNENKINLNIPYYNENCEYLQNNTLSTKDQYDNLYKLMDRISFVSRYLLKGNDYYKLYISKNANKYFNHDTINNDDVDNSTNTNTTNVDNTTNII